jgi:glycosyltransferase involved in cell wall biosynthesis
LNIVLLTREYPPDTHWGGCASVNHALARGLAGYGHRVHVICQAVGKPKEYRDEGVVVHRVGNNPTQYTALARIDYSICAWTKLRQLLRAEDVQIVQADYWSAEGFLYCLSLRRKAPLLVMGQSGPTESLETKTYSGWIGAWNLRLLSVLADWTAGRADRVVFDSYPNFRQLQRRLHISPSRVAVVPLGVDTQVYRFVASSIRRDLGISQTCPLVLTVGRLEPRKGQHILCDAIPGIAERFPEARFVLVGRDSSTAPGGGSFREWIESRTQERGFADRLLFLDFIPIADLVALMSACDVFVVPSLEESFGLVTAEAMACGRPVVATAKGIAPELGLDGTNGVVVPVGDSNALAAGVTEVLSLPPQERQEIAERNRSIIETGFSSARHTQGMLEVYQDLLAAHNQRN